MSADVNDPITATYGHGSIKLTAYPSSRRIRVEATADNSVMDWSDLLEFADRLWLPRTITTAEELDALPYGSVVLSAVYIAHHGQAISFQRWEDGLWHRGARSSHTHPDNFLPVTVLHEPEAAK